MVKVPVCQSGRCQSCIGDKRRYALNQWGICRWSQGTQTEGPVDRGSLLVIWRMMFVWHSYGLGLLPIHATHQSGQGIGIDEEEEAIPDVEIENCLTPEGSTS
ncbi:UNVERIFIED_CONTAM: hypothetical protein K2H54_049606 [Gekko kuhli]